MMSVDPADKHPLLGESISPVRSGSEGSVLWWGRFDPEYSRNRLLRGLLHDHGWRIIDFIPRISALGRLEAAWRQLPRPDLVWVPAFRHHDLLPARRWSAARGLPLLFDPLISAYDKRVFERKKFATNSRQAKKLLAWERRIMQAADLLLADTEAHAGFYHEVLGAAPERTYVVPVGAESALFYPESDTSKGEIAPSAHPPEVLFYGSFIPLQGPQYIAEAIRCYQGPAVRWCFLGDGPLQKRCRELIGDCDNVCFEPWLPYRQLPQRIRQADILLGIFGDTPKTQRVIPNKVFQAMACGRPIITARTPAYPKALLQADDDSSGLVWVPAAEPSALATAVSRLAADADARYRLGQAANRTFRAHFSGDVIWQALHKALLYELSG